MNIHSISETSLQSLLQHPANLHILKMVDVLFLDEVGQISCAMLSCLDIIFPSDLEEKYFPWWFVIHMYSGS